MDSENEDKDYPGCGLMGCMGGTLFGGVFMILFSLADAVFGFGGGDAYTNMVENVFVFSIVAGVVMGIVGTMIAYIRRESSTEPTEEDDFV
ncbi:hypothetical protein GF402_07570 [Candidatus Fermentibacteria bacterium]|nr:hypothetical protein [Candidatus Fermentibacteria bacterium]